MIVWLGARWGKEILLLGITDRDNGMCPGSAVHRTSRTSKEDNWLHGYCTTIGLVFEERADAEK